MGARKRDDAADARVEALGDALDDAALAGGVAPLEEHDDLEALQPYPFLQLEELELQAGQFVDVGVFLARRPGRPRVAEDVPAPFDPRLLLGVAQHLAAHMHELQIVVVFPWPAVAITAPVGRGAMVGQICQDWVKTRLRS